MTEEINLTSKKRKTMEEEKKIPDIGAPISCNYKGWISQCDAGRKVKSFSVIIADQIHRFAPASGFTFIPIYEELRHGISCWIACIEGNPAMGTPKEKYRQNIISIDFIEWEDE